MCNTVITRLFLGRVWAAFSPSGKFIRRRRSWKWEDEKLRGRPNLRYLPRVAKSYWSELRLNGLTRTAATGSATSDTARASTTAWAGTSHATTSACGGAAEATTAATSTEGALPSHALSLDSLEISNGCLITFPRRFHCTLEGILSFFGDAAHGIFQG